MMMLYFIMIFIMIFHDIFCSSMLPFGVYGVYSGDPGMGLAGLDFSWCQAPDRGLPCPDGIFFLHIDEKAKVVVIYNNLYIIYMIIDIVINVLLLIIIVIIIIKIQDRILTSALAKCSTIII